MSLLKEWMVRRADTNTIPNLCFVRALNNFLKF